MITPLAVTIGFLIVCFIGLTGFGLAGLGAAYEKMWLIVFGGCTIGAGIFGFLAGCVYLLAAFITALAT